MKTRAESEAALAAVMAQLSRIAEDAGVLQLEVARRMEVKQGTLNAWVRSRNPLPAWRLWQWASVFGLTLELQSARKARDPDDELGLVFDAARGKLGRSEAEALQAYLAVVAGR